MICARSNTTTASAPSSNGMSLSAVIGGVVGGLGVLVLVTAVIVVLVIMVVVVKRRGSVGVAEKGPGKKHYSANMQGISPKFLLGKLT